MENFDIGRFLKVLSNSKLYICLILLLFLTMGYFYSFYFVTPMYQSSATVVLVQNDSLDASTDSSSITQSDISLNQNLLSTYTKIAKSSKVLEQVIDNLNLDISVQSLSSLVSVQAVNNTEVFKISVNNKDKFLAASIANELIDVFSNEVKSLYNMNNVYAMDMAEVTDTPYNVNHIKDIALFAMIGIVASFGLVALIYMFDTTIKSERDVEDYANLAVLSTIPEYINKQNKCFNDLIVNEQPKSPIAECFKTFRTNIMFSIQNKKLNTILVTSGFMGEGKSFVSSNLAVTFASSGKKVILVDTDMRKGRIHKIFNLSNKRGLSNCLSSIGNDGSLVNINDYICKSGIPNLHVMTSGDVPPNPSELLSSPNMKKFLEALNTQYDVVICDGTPCMLVADSIILSKIVDTTVIVTANKVTKLDTLLKIKKSIEIVGGNIGGAVINKMSMSSKSYQNKYYYGNHNEVSQMFDSVSVDDSLLDNTLFVDSDVAIDTPVDKEVFVGNTDVTNNENNIFGNLSDLICDNTKQISELKILYKNVMQNTLDAISNKNSNSIVVEELNSIRASYEDAINAQNKYIARLDDKISNFKVENNSNVVLDELNSIRASYEDAINAQNEYIAKLDDKISNFKVEDNSSIVLDELNSIKASYEDAINAQNNEITNLNNRVSNIKVNDNSEILNAVANIYKQLETMNTRFDYLEKKALDNENLIKNINADSHRKSKVIDVKKLDENVIRIQDYLENSYNINLASSNSSRKNRNILEGQIDLLDSLLENSSNFNKIDDETQNSIKSSVVSYDKFKNKQKRGLFAFKSNNSVDDYVDEEVNIVSQILSGNKQEFVG